jgi:hypothetical protein
MKLSRWIIRVQCGAILDLVAEVADKVFARETLTICSTGASQPLALQMLGLDVWWPFI